MTTEHLNISSNRVLQNGSLLIAIPWNPLAIQAPYIFQNVRLSS